jgi:hypothetical protein
MRVMTTTTLVMKSGSDTASHTNMQLQTAGAQPTVEI